MRKTVGLVALIGLFAALLFLWNDARRPSEERSTPAAPAVSALQTASAATPPSLAPPEPRAASPIDPSDPPLPAAPSEPSVYPVDLEALRTRLPDNSYWRLGAPTKDAAQLRERAERARQTNELYGKVLSTTATVEEIERYYAERQRVSEDYIQFAALVLKEYRDQLPEEHIGLYELSIRLHSARLDEIPRDREAALARLRAKKR